MAVQYYKITNREEIHHGFPYQDGLNVLKEPFNDDEQKSCVAGGFYFSDKQNIKNFFSYGSNLRIIYLPTEDRDFKMVKDPAGDKWRANKIIFGEKHSLYNPGTYKLLDLCISDNKDLPTRAAIEGNIDFLMNQIEQNYNSDVIDHASANGHIDILQWCQDSITPFFHTENAMDLASDNGHVNVLQWWKDSGLKLLYTDDAMDSASRNGHIHVLDWWKKSGLKMKYSFPIFVACSYGRVDVLEWWKKNIFDSDKKLENNSFLNGTMNIDIASVHGHINVLQWWKESGWPFTYSKHAINGASNERHINVLQWWKDSGLPFKYTQDMIDAQRVLAYVNNDHEFLNWWTKYEPYKS